MKRIPLTQGKFVQVDNEDFEWLNQWKWQAKKEKGGQRFYAIRHQETINGKRPLVYMHRLILNVPKDMQTDHVDMDGLNCQRHNIRICTQRQNGQNRRSMRGSSSKYKGVSWHKGAKKWCAYIRFNGKLLSLKYHDIEENAARAYDVKAIELFGEFARTNATLVPEFGISKR